MSQSYTTITDLLEGTYTYYIWINDTAGNFNQTEIRTIIIDLLPPSIIIESPLNKSYNTSIIDFNVTATDIVTRVDTCSYSLDNASNITLSNDTGTHFYGKNSTMTDGKHTVTIYCNDTTGNMNSKTQYFTVDTTPPNIILISPKNKIYNISSVWFNATVSDITTSVNWCGYSLDNNINITLSNNTITNYYSLNTTMTDGAHNVTIYCNDSVGNLNYTESLDFTVDTTPPIIQVISPNKPEYATKNIWFQFNVFEPESAISQCSYSFDGAEYIILNPKDPNYYSKLLYNLPDGTHNVTYYCENTVGFSTTTPTIYFNITTTSVLIKLVGAGFLPDVNTKDNYIASELPQRTVTGLVHADGDFKGVSDNNGMTLRNSIGSITYLVYTQGTTDDIKDRTEHIKSGEFEKMPNPSFGFPITNKYLIQIGLEYNQIDFNGKDQLNEGFYEFEFKNIGVIGNKLSIEIKR